MSLRGLYSRTYAVGGLDPTPPPSPLCGEGEL